MTYRHFLILMFHKDKVMMMGIPTDYKSHPRHSLCILKENLFDNIVKLEESCNITWKLTYFMMEVPGYFIQ